jgi:Xaa-Pro aminopeptidase
MPHAVPTDRRIRRGDFVTLDFGCVADGYCSDMTRTVAVGEACGEMREVYAIVLEAQAAGIAAARAGVIGKEIDAAARRVIADAGYGEYFGHGFGHGLGIEVHETPNANSGEDKALPAGAVISAEPGIYLPGRFGVRIEDTLVLTQDGSENLMKAAKNLTVV